MPAGFVALSSVLERITIVPATPDYGEECRVIDWNRMRRGAAIGLAMMVVSIGAASMVAAQEEAGAYVPEGCWADDARTDEAGFPQWESAPEMVIDEDATYTAIVTTNKGEMTFELNTEAAPNTVNNFVCLVANGFYDITPFHRVIAGFMVQGGDPTGTGTGGPGYRFGDELPGDDLEYVKGTLAMANAGPDTQGSQFFIVHDDLQGGLDKNYTIFGQLTEGEDVLDDIADTPVVASRSGEPSMPAEFLVITNVTIQESTDS